MDLFEENLAAVNRLDPNLVDRLRSDDEDETVVLSPTSEGVPTLGVRRGGRTYMLHHPQTPLSDTRERINSLGDASSTWNFAIFGIGLGYLPLLLLRDRVRPPDLLLLVEPSISVFRAACKTVDLRPVLRRPSCCLLVGQPVTALYEIILANLLLILANRITLIKHAPTAELYPDWIREQEARFHDAWRLGQLSLTTKHRTGQAFVSNLLRNLPAYARSRGIAAGRGTLRGTPAVIAAAGPSLKKNIDRLPKLREHALLLGVDTVLDRLIEAGAPPHLVVAIDPSELNLRHFRRDSYSGVRLAFDPESYPVSDRFGDGILTYTTNRAPFFAWLDERLGPKGTVERGSMVSQAAFHLAAYWGCDPIILIGQDLALDPETGETHHSQAALVRKATRSREDEQYVEYSAVGEGGLIEREKIFRLPGALGDRVPVPEKLLSYLRLVERDVARTAARVIDATEGGALIAGTQVLSADEVIRQIRGEVFDFESFWAWLGRKGASSEEALSAVRREMRERMNRCAESARRARDLVDDLASRDSTAATISRRLDPFRSLVFEDPVTDYFVQHLAWAPVFEFLRRGPADATEEQDRDDVARRYTALVEATLQAYETLLGWLDGSD